MQQVRSWAAEVDFPSVCPDEAVFPAGHLDGVFNTQTPNPCEDPNSSFTTPLQTSPTSQVKKIENP